MIKISEEKNKREYQQKANLIFDKLILNKKVYGFKDKPKLRFCLPPNLSISLPKKARVLWSGHEYEAKLSTVNGWKKSKVPVYAWEVGK